MPHITSVDDLKARIATVGPMPIPMDPELRRAIRVRAGLDMATVGRVLGVRPLTVARWETEGRKPWRIHADGYGRLLRVCREIAEPIDRALRKVA